MEEMMGPDRYRWAALNDEERLAGAAALALSQLYAEQGDGDSRRGAWALPQYDPYSKASVASGVRPTLPMLLRHKQAEPCVPSSGTSRGTRRLVMKRKVLRRRPDGGVEISDESVASEPETSVESDPEVWNLQQKLLHLSTHLEDSISEGEIESNSSFLDEPSPELFRHRQTPPFLLRDFQSQSSPSSQQDTSAVGQPKSFIPPRLEQLGRNRGKTDRVAKYFEYKRDWEMFRIPGEDQRKELRWGIREQMLYKPDLPSKPQHFYVPNSYIVPTEKKRAALRWEVRCDLANGLIPRKSSSS
ncbi:centriolar and ciliogenesis-associated protein HYLS1 isoform X2 [Struthio camelus]